MRCGADLTRCGADLAWCGADLTWCGVDVRGTALTQLNASYQYTGTDANNDHLYLRGFFLVFTEIQRLLKNVLVFCMKSKQMLQISLVNLKTFRSEISDLQQGYGHRPW